MKVKTLVIRYNPKQSRWFQVWVNGKYWHTPSCMMSYQLGGFIKEIEHLLQLKQLLRRKTT